MELDHSGGVFRALNRQLPKVAKKPAPEMVHKFRTRSRRVEVLLSELARKKSRNDKKLLKLLTRLRKKAGRVRDLDVQLGALRSLKMPQEPGRKSRLLRTLAEERGQREEKLIKAFDKKTIAEIRKRLSRSADSLEILRNADPVALARQKIAELNQPSDTITDETLHQFRIIGKRARYIAELAAKDPAAVQLVGQLRHMQDAIGEWHDWLQLTERAEKLFGGMRDSALVAALHNVTRAKRHQAVHTLTGTRALLSGQKLVSPRPFSMQSSRPAVAPASAVA